MYKNFLLILVISLSCGLTESASAKEPCIKDRAKLLSLDAKTFDQTKKKGWRSLPKSKHCYAAKADLIHEFRTTKSEQELVPYRYLMVWHEAQFRAFLGQTDEAVLLFEESKMKVPNNKAWGYYADTTIAFLQQDKHAAIAAVNAMQALPIPSKLSKRSAKNWPPKLRVAKGLIRCFDRSYEYAVKKCR